MDQPPYEMDWQRREIVLPALIEHCRFREWPLWAAHVRSNHVHVVVAAEVVPERVMNALKAYASRRLNESSIDGLNRKRWARHGSTRWLRDQESIAAAIRYVVDGQGEPMSVFVA